MYYHLYKGNDPHLTQRMILQNAKSQKKNDKMNFIYIDEITMIVS